MTPLIQLSATIGENDSMPRMLQRAGVGSSDAAQLGRKPKERLHRHIRIQRGILRQIANLGFGLNRGLLDVVTADRDRPAGRRNKPGNHPHGGGLARTVGTEETKDLALGDRERNVVYGQLRTELFG